MKRILYYVVSPFTGAAFASFCTPHEAHNYASTLNKRHADDLTKKDESDYAFAKRHNLPTRDWSCRFTVTTSKED